jgi:hypothetical protein
MPFSLKKSGLGRPWVGFGSVGLVVAWSGLGSARVCHGRDGVVLSMGLLGRCLF